VVSHLKHRRSYSRFDPKRKKITDDKERPRGFRHRPRDHRNLLYPPRTYKNMQAAFSSHLRNLPRTVVYAPSSAAKAAVAASPASQPTQAGCPGSCLSYFYIYIREALQTAGLKDCAPHCAKILSSMYARTLL
jgi:hypothetical protein